MYLYSLQRDLEVLVEEEVPKDYQALRVTLDNQVLRGYKENSVHQGLKDPADL